MSKIQCRHCGFNNPANLDVCVKCNKPFHTNVGQKWLTKFTQLFPTSKKTPAAPDKQIEKIKDLSNQVILSAEGVHYDVGGLLGRGGYCDVYIGRNQQTNEKVAIKLLRFWEIVQRAREEVETRFWFEYRMALTDSPYLVKATEHGDVGGVGSRRSRCDRAGPAEHQPDDEGNGDDKAADDKRHATARAFGRANLAHGGLVVVLIGHRSVSML